MTAECKLILIEGVPGAGKTTTAQLVRDWLASRGAQPRLHLEGDLDHPADYESIACLSAPVFSDLLARFPVCSAELNALAERRNGDVFVGYRKLAQRLGEQMPAGLLETLAQAEVYELPLDKFRQVTLDHWADFAREAAAQPYTYIFECAFMQNPFTTLKARHNLDDSSVIQHVYQAAERVACLRPALIYLDPPNIAANLDRAAAERPSEWLAYVIGYITGQAWGQASGQRGLEGMKVFYQQRRDQEKIFFDRLEWPKLWVANAGADWPAAQQTICQFLDAFI